MFAADKYKPDLFNQDSDSDEGAPTQFGTNKEFAKNFNKLRSKELQKKHKSADDSDDSSSDDSDDSSDNDTINPKFDEAFYKALASIKKKDPKIYNGDVKFFDEFDAEPTAEVIGGSKSSKPMTVVDYERKILLEKGGIYEEDDDEHDDEDDEKTARPQSPSYNQEQQNLRAAFKKVIDDESDDADEVGAESGNAEWGGIFKRRDKSKAEEAAEEEQYTKWLAGKESANIGENAAVLQPLKEYWTDPKLAKEEAFLRDYILNNGYTKRSAVEVPCYDDIVGNRTTAVEEADGDDDDAAAQLSDDEDELEKQAEFEHKYNFRFEEPDAEFIKRYPRTIENSVRRTDDRRKDKRQEVKDRKQRDKEQKLRELELLSAMRKRDIEEKMAKLKAVTGDEVLPFDDGDLDGDWDPEEYDRKMGAVFNSEYYQIDEGDEKPECPADLEDLQVEDWDNYDPEADGGDADNDGNDGAGHCDDNDFDMDCEADAAAEQKRTFQSDLIENTRAGGKRKRKRKSKLAQILQTKKPAFDPTENKSYGEYLDEYYKLDYEDVIGDVPCRFKYTETVPNDFGLTVEEILLAKNKELNQWASLKKATQIRPEHVERNEIGMYKQKGRNEALKRKILQSLFEESSDEDEAAKPASNEKFSKKVANNKKQQVSNKAEDNFVVLEESNKTEKVETKSKTGKKLQDKPSKTADTSLDKRNNIPTSEKKPKVPIHKKSIKIIRSNSDSVAASPSNKLKMENSDGATKITTESFKTTLKRSKPDAIPSQTSPPASKKAKLEHPTPTSDGIVKKLSKNAIKKQKRIQQNPQQANNTNRNPAKSAQHKKPIPGISSGTAISDERLRAFGINPKKYHNKQKYGTGAKQNQPKPSSDPKASSSAVPKTKSSPNNTKNAKSPNVKSGQQRQSRPQADLKRGSAMNKANREALDRMKAKMFAKKHPTAE